MKKWNKKTQLTLFLTRDHIWIFILAFYCTLLLPNHIYDHSLHMILSSHSMTLIGHEVMFAQLQTTNAPQWSLFREENKLLYSKCIYSTCHITLCICLAALVHCKYKNSNPSSGFSVTSDNCGSTKLKTSIFHAYTKSPCNYIHFYPWNTPSPRSTDTKISTWPTTAKVYTIHFYIFIDRTLPVMILTANNSTLLETLEA
jgi:hypothetical protein